MCDDRDGRRIGEKVAEGLRAEQELGLGAQCGHDGTGTVFMPDAGEEVLTGPPPQPGDASQRAIDEVMGPQ